MDDQTLSGRETGVDLQSTSMNSRPKVGSREMKQNNLSAADGIKSYPNLAQKIV
jgi:hypothetical protein